MNRSSNLAAATVLLLAWLAGCSGLTKEQAKMRVELDVFSGRPNPSWELSAQDVTALKTRLAGLPRQAQPIADTGLGYRGIVITNPQAAPDFPTEIRAYEGGLAVRDQTGLTHYQDIHEVEHWLLEQARSHGHGALLDQLGKH